MSFNTKLIVPLALGLSLVSVTAYVVYYVFKKEEDEDNTKRSIKSSRTNVVEISVPKSIVPALIGRNGSKIKDLEKQSGARIHFKKFQNEDFDICIIQGRAESTQLAETFVHDFIKNQPVFVEDHIMVPGWACGRIIGSGGESINNISHSSGARVKVESAGPNDSLGMKKITFRGTTEQIEAAKKLVEACVSQEKCRREIEQSKRTSRHVLISAPHDHPNASSTVPTETAKGIEPSNEPTEMPGDTTKPKHARKSEASGAAIEVYVSAVSSPSRFWVQFVGPQVAQLDELVQQMSDYYGNKDNREAHALTHVSIGQVVAAVFRHDGRWYRARIADIKANEFDPTQQVADVFYVDYGDSEYVAVHELCELRADLLRLRFQAMECFLAGVKPAGKEEDVVGVTPTGHRWDKWNQQAIDRFEELTQVARWKPLVSKTCTYKKTMTGDGDTKEKEIPGIKLYDVTEEGELDIGAVLITEGYAVIAPPTASPRASPARGPALPFGDLGASRVLGMVNERSERASSLPKNHERTEHAAHTQNGGTPKDLTFPTSQSLASGLESAKHHTPADFNQPKVVPDQTNGSQDFLHTERQQVATESDSVSSPLHHVQEQFKANMNRIDSHHGNLEALGRQHELHK